MVLKVPPHSKEEGSSAKRLLFSKPSWSKPQNLESSGLFHRSEHIYAASSAQLERKRRERKARKENVGVPKEEDIEPVVKRQRLTQDDDEEDEGDDENQDEDNGDDDDSEIESDDNEDDSRPQNQSDCSANSGPAPSAQTGNDTTQKAITQPTPTTTNRLKSPISNDENYQKKSAPALTQRKPHYPSIPNVIDLDDDEDRAQALAPRIPKVELSEKKACLEADEIVASDEEFPELARKAREKARNRVLEEKLSAQNAIPSLSMHTSSRLPPPKTISPPDPTLQILITSSIPDTTPLIVSRKLSQRLKDVRLAWVERQHFPRGFTQLVFLTWRGKRLFDVTTCKSLGIRVDIDGRVLSKGDVLGNEEGRIHMEAMTFEILESRRKAKMEEGEDQTAASEIENEIQKPVEEQIRIILKAKGLEDFKLKVKANTLVSKILSAFRNANSLSEERNVYIMFEGQCLEPASTVEDAEIADLDTLDTYVK